jgi:four helix bundle protein
MRDARASQRVLIWQVAAELRSEIAKLTRAEAIDADHRLRSHLEDSAEDVGRNIENALATDHPGEFARFVRLARAAINDVQSHLRTALMKKRLAEADAREVRELLSRLYPALSSLLATANSRSETPGRSPSYSRPSATSSRN